MALNTKIIGGLAWTGLVLILAVPSADLVSSQLSPKSSLTMTSDTDQIQTASIADPVDAFVQSGKPLPSYISDGPVTAPKPTVKVLPPSGVTQPMPVTMPAAPSTTPAETEVASVPTIAPEPYPASMRPSAPPVTDPIVTSSIGVGEDVAVLPEADTPAVGRPKAPIEPRYVSEEELADWDSGSLADYLERRGLIAEASYDEGSSAEFDSDGFFLDEGPNNNRTLRSRSRRDDDGFFFVFPD
jgi:hypothetical protein